MLCRYTRHLDTPTFRLLKQMLPGPYTALLPASREVPRYLQNKQVVGLRIPDHPFCLGLTKLLGEPIITTSANLCRPAHPQHRLGAGGGTGPCPGPRGGLRPAHRQGSTIVDLTGEEPVLVREGAGPWPV